jgi:hypothetical protein
MGALAAGSALMALGGAFLTISAFNAFFFGMVNGRGWVCILLSILVLVARRSDYPHALMKPYISGER